jgi:hypothetical protein
MKESNRKTRLSYKPLISRSAWFIITVSIIVLLLVCILVLQTGKSTEVINYFSIWERVTDLFNKIDFTLSFNSDAFLIFTMAIASMGLLLFFDFFISSQKARIKDAI